MLLRVCALGAILSLIVTAATAGPIGFEFDARFVGDSLSHGQADSTRESPQVFGDLNAGDVLSGLIRFDHAPTSPVECFADCGFQFEFSEDIFCGRKATDSITVNAYTPGSRLDVEMVDFASCWDELVMLSLDGDGGTLIYEGYPDKDRSNLGVYSAEFELFNVRESSSVQLLPMPVPASGLMLLALLVLAGGVAIRRTRA